MSKAKPMTAQARYESYGEGLLTPRQRRRADKHGHYAAAKTLGTRNGITEPKGRPTPRRKDAIAARRARRA